MNRGTRKALILVYLIMLIVFIGSARADKIDECLDNPIKVWNTEKEKCQDATDEELPYAKRGK